MTGARITACGLLLALLAAALPAQAHRLNLFAVWDGTRVTGEAYFTGGGRAKDIDIRALAADGRLLSQARTDSQGNFALPPLPPADMEIVVDAGDGHVARFRIAAGEMNGAPAPGTPAPVAAVPAAPDAFSRDGLEAAVERAVARRLAPLQRQIAEYEARVRLHDVLGGIGYLVGVGGLGFWWLARREAKGGKP